MHRCSENKTENTDNPKRTQQDRKSWSMMYAFYTNTHFNGSVTIATPHPAFVASLSICVNLFLQVYIFNFLLFCSVLAWLMFRIDACACISDSWFSVSFIFQCPGEACSFSSFNSRFASLLASCEKKKTGPPSDRNGIFFVNNGCFYF